MTSRLAPARPVPLRWHGRAAAIAAAAGAALLALFIVHTQFGRRCPSFDTWSQFGGLTQGLASPAGDQCSAWRNWVCNDVRLLIPAYLLLGLATISYGWRHYTAPQLTTLDVGVLVLPIITAVLDWIEDVLLLTTLRDPITARAPLHFINGFAAGATSTVSWIKWVSAAVTAVVVVMSLAVAFRKKAPTAPGLDVQLTPPADLPPQAWGLCVSGGGIRAAGFALGAISGLEGDGERPTDGQTGPDAKQKYVRDPTATGLGQDVTARFTTLSAVSGGAYTAAAWILGRTKNLRARQVLGMLADAPDNGRARLPYLFNAPGGLGRSLVRAVGGVLYSLLAIAVFTALFAWPVGYLVGHFIQPGLRSGDLSTGYTGVHHQWLPGAAIGAVGLVLLARVTWRTLSARALQIAVGIILIGVLFEVLLVLLPLALLALALFLQGAPAATITTATGITSLVAAVGFVWKSVSKTVLASASKLLPRLGGALLLIAMLVWAIWIAESSATDKGALRYWWVWVTAIGLFIFYYLSIRPVRAHLSMQRTYGYSLARTFDTTTDLRQATKKRKNDPIGYSWQHLAEDHPKMHIPEIVLGCTQATTHTGFGGFKGETFTISPREIRWTHWPEDPGTGLVPIAQERSMDTQAYLSGYGTTSSMRSVTQWLGITGAAFASSMGRHSLGTTNALLAAANISLGSWLLNPDAGTAAPTGTRPPAPGLSYLWKEILGWYNQQDQYVFITDGGHWDNLGLVELLRRRCPIIVCIDASGDADGRDHQTFATLHEALTLAVLTLPWVTGFTTTDLASITPQPDQPARQLACKITAVSTDDTTSTIYYAKAQIAADTTQEVLRFAAADRTFPDYSTGDQLLSGTQFRALYALGQQAANDIKAQMRTDTVLPGPPPSA